MGRKSQFTQEQIIRVLQEVDAGAKPEAVCRRLDVSDTTFYRWKSKYDGMDVSEAKRLKPPGTVAPLRAGRSHTLPTQARVRNPGLFFLGSRQEWR